MMGFPFGGFGASGLFSILFTLIFAAILVCIIIAVIRGARQWNRNNHSPVLTVDAVVTAKRTDVHVHHHNNAGMEPVHNHTTSSTTYYATFQVPSGDRMEFTVRSTEYGLLAEQDRGKLTFQGTRYLGFDRERT